MIELQSISKRFDKVDAVLDVSFQVQAGRILGFLGPNGAGKTTSIRMLMNIIQPDEGAILFNGSATRPTASQIGYLPEERGLYQKISLFETLQYFASLRNVTNADQKIIEYLERFDLDSRMSSKVSELSKGNQQKVQFINTILHDPQYVVLDEPFSGLDPVNQLLLKEILEEMKRKGKTIIFSSHQMDQVEKVCDDVALIHKGQLLLAGDLKAIKATYGNLFLEITPENSNDLSHAFFTEHEAEIRGSSAFIPLRSDNHRDLIRKANEMFVLRSIRIAEPGLEEIFIHQVGGGDQ